MLWYVKYNYYWNQFLECNENELCIDVYYKQSLWNKMFWVITVMSNLSNLWNKMFWVITYNYCAFMFIISNHYGIKCVSNLLQLEPCNDMFKVISDIMAHCNVMWNTSNQFLEKWIMH